MLGFGHGIRTLGDLRQAIEELDHLSDEVPLAMAVQPNWPFRHSIAGIAVVEPRTCAYPDGEDNGEHDHAECEDVVAEDSERPGGGYHIYFVEGGQEDYLPGDAAREIGWR